MKEKDLISRNAKPEELSRVMTAYNDAVTMARRDLMTLKQNRDSELQKIRQSEMSLFDTIQEGLTDEARSRVEERTADEIAKSETSIAALERREETATKKGDVERSLEAAEQKLREITGTDNWEKPSGEKPTEPVPVKAETAAEKKPEPVPVETAPSEPVKPKLSVEQQYAQDKIKQGDNSVAEESKRHVAAQRAADLKQEKQAELSNLTARQSQLRREIGSGLGTSEQIAKAKSELGSVNEQIGKLKEQLDMTGSGDMFGGGEDLSSAKPEQPKEPVAE